jgi:hypothetical protein
LKKTFALFLSLLCIAIVAVLFIPNANVRGGTFVVQPTHEVTENVNVTTASAKTWHTIETIQFNLASPAIPPSPSSPEDRRPYWDDPYAKWLNFLRTTEILRSLNEELQRTFPISSFPSVVICGILVMYAVGLTIIHLHETNNKVSFQIKRFLHSFALYT